VKERKEFTRGERGKREREGEREREREREMGKRRGEKEKFMLVKDALMFHEFTKL
jgi:hypothetical protein